MPPAASAATAPAELQTRLTAAQTSLKALGVNIIIGRCPAPCADTRCAAEADGAVWDYNTSTLRIADDLTYHAQLVVMVDMWSAIVIGPHAARHAYRRRPLALISTNTPRRANTHPSRRRFPTVLAAAVPLLAAACLYPAVAPMTPAAQQTPLPPAATAPAAPAPAPPSHLARRRTIVQTVRTRRRPTTRTLTVRLDHDGDHDGI